MATFTNQDFTTFRGVNLRGSIGLRFTADVDGNQSTLAIKASTDAARQYYLPDKSGTFGVTGTFSVDLPAVSANGYLSTIVTVTGIRIEDGVVVTPQTGRGVAVQSARGAVVITEALAGNGNLTLLFWNVAGTATIPMTNVYAYTTVR